MDLSAERSGEKIKIGKEIELGLHEKGDRAPPQSESRLVRQRRGESSSSSLGGWERPLLKKRPMMNSIKFLEGENRKKRGKKIKEGLTKGKNALARRVSPHS